MIKKFRVQNFMCLKDVTVELEPMTIFVGPNSSGKSAFFKALTTFHRLLWYPVRGGPGGEFNVEAFQRGGGVTLDEAVWKGDSSKPIIFEVWFWENETGAPDYTLELRRDYSGWNVRREKFVVSGDEEIDTQESFIFTTTEGEKRWDAPYTAPLAYLTRNFANDSLAVDRIRPIQELRTRLGAARRYRPSANEIASPQALLDPQKRPGRRGKAAEFVPEPDETGRRLVFALQQMLLTQRDTFSELEKELNTLHPHILGMSFKTDWRGIGLRYKTSRVSGDVSASQESDGVLLSTFLLWRLYSATTSSFKICLEEPENGVHLSMLKQRYEILKKFATTGGARPTPQILIATHSRDFLNALGSRASILQEVRVVECDETSGSSIWKLGHWREINQLLDEVRDQMGDLWWSNRLQGRERSGSSG